MSRGKRDKIGELAPLSGLLYCDSCGSKMRQVGSANRKYMAYMCGYHNRFGKGCCTTHYIRRPLIEQYILMDIQDTLIGKLTASGMTYDQIAELADDSSADTNGDEDDDSDSDDNADYQTTFFDNKHTPYSD